MIVFGLGKNLLFKFVLGHCDFLPISRNKYFFKKNFLSLIVFQHPYHITSKLSKHTAHLKNRVPGILDHSKLRFKQKLTHDQLFFQPNVITWQELGSFLKIKNKNKRYVIKKNIRRSEMKLLRMLKKF